MKLAWTGTHFETKHKMWYPQAGDQIFMQKNITTAIFGPIQGDPGTFRESLTLWLVPDGSHF